MRNIIMANIQKCMLYQTGLLDAIRLNQFFHTVQKMTFFSIGSFKTSEPILSFQWKSFSNEKLNLTN